MGSKQLGTHLTPSVASEESPLGDSGQDARAAAEALGTTLPWGRAWCFQAVSALLPSPRFPNKVMCPTFENILQKKFDQQLAY